MRAGVRDGGLTHSIAACVIREQVAESGDESVIVIRRDEQAGFSVHDDGAAASTNMRGAPSRPAIDDKATTSTERSSAGTSERGPR